MNPSMDDRRALAEIERCLGRDDPGLVSRMDALNEKFTEAKGDGPVERQRWDGRWVAALVLVVVALFAVILTAVFTAPPAAEKSEQPPPIGRAPAMSVYVR